MAIRFDATADAAHISSAGGLFGKTWSICGWMYHVADTTSHTFLYIRSANSGGTQFVSLATDGLKKFRIEDHGGSSSYGSTLNDNQWYFVALRVNDGGASECLIDGASYITRTTTTQTDSGTQSLFLGGSTAQHVNCRLMGIKVWDGVALTNAEFEQERQNLRPSVQLDKLWGWWPMFHGSSERLRNWAVGGRDLTADGTLADEDPGPTAWIVSAPVAVPAVSGDTVGSASGTGTASGVGASTAASTAAASGTGTAAGVGASTAAATASASGTGTASATGAAIFSGDGAASGLGTATGVGASTAAATGAAAGTGTAAAIGASTAASTGAATGTGSASGVGASTAETVGAASGAGTASGVGASTAAAVGSASGVGTATGFAPGVQSGDGAAAGTGTATGVGASTAAAVGTATGTGTASGVGTDATPSSGGQMPASAPFIGSVGQLKVLLPIESAGGGDWPDLVVQMGLENVYDQAPGRANEKGLLLAPNKTPAGNASSLPGGSGTLVVDVINVPRGTTSNYDRWDFTDTIIIVDGDDTIANFTNCLFAGVGGSGFGIYLAMGTGGNGALGHSVVTVDHCEYDGALRGQSFAGGFYMVNTTDGSTVDLTVTNSYLKRDALNFFVRAGVDGSTTVEDNWIGPGLYNNPIGDTSHYELHHSFELPASSVFTNETCSWQRNFCDGRGWTGGTAAGVVTGYLFMEFPSTASVWTIKDNIFLGFGDQNDASGLEASFAFQMSGVGSLLFANNIVQQDTTGAPGYFSAGGTTIDPASTGNYRWTEETLINEGGLS